jgi:hypothetical protein
MLYVKARGENFDIQIFSGNQYSHLPYCQGFTKPSLGNAANVTGKITNFQTQSLKESLTAVWLKKNFFFASTVTETHHLVHKILEIGYILSQFNLPGILFLRNPFPYCSLIYI